MSQREPLDTMFYIDVSSLLFGLNLLLSVTIGHVQYQSSMSKLNSFPMLTRPN